MFENQKAVYSFLLALFLLINADFVSAQSDPERRFLGVGTCASSNCHGSVNGSNTSPVLRNEFYTWYKFDKHARSYRTLLGPESKRIAYHLGLKEPHTEKLCLDCHATNETAVGEKFRLEDGVGCESCHGAAESWIQGHTEKGATHAGNVANGLHDLSKLSTRATLCSSCHFGDDTKEVTHKLYGAGHPRLSFELDTFEAVAPRHWKIDKDYIERKGAYRPTEGWAYGQLALARLQLDQIKRHREGRELFPEFSQFSCFSCHQSMTGKSFMHRERSSSTGLPHLNTVHLDMVAVVLAATQDSSYQKWTSQVEALTASIDPEQSLEAINQLQSHLTSISLNVEKLTSRSVVSALRSYGQNHGWIDFQLAEQLVMALSSAYSEEKRIDQPSMNSLYKLVAKPETYNSGYFSTALKSIE